MGGFFGAASKWNCEEDVYYGTDYHSHLGTQFGGRATSKHDGEIVNSIHDIRDTQFRSKFETEREKMEGNLGIGIISDTDAQPLIIRSSLGTYALVTVGRINNLDVLANQVLGRGGHFAEVSTGQINPTEMMATLINQGKTFVEGIRFAQEMIDGSCSLLLLTKEGVYAARDRFGRTPVVIGKKDGACAAASESCAFFNLGYALDRYLGPGEVVLLTETGITQVMPAWGNLRICGFLWVYYGFPASSYEGINVEIVRYRCGAALAKSDKAEIDFVAGIPDSGTAHGLGYANEAGVPYKRPYVKYTPTWARSFTPQEQQVRNLVAKMKLIPISELIQGQRILFCEDSIVRGTQLKETIKRLFDVGVREVHMRPACPPLIYGCKFLNFSRSRSELDLAGRKAIEEVAGGSSRDFKEYAPLYADSRTTEYARMVERVKDRLGLTTLRYQELSNLIKAIGLPKEKVCTYCWDGVG